MMGKNPLLATFLLLFLIVADVSDASNASLLFKFRKLIGSAPNNSAPNNSSSVIFLSLFDFLFVWGLEIRE